MPKKKKKKGFTLIELLVVIAIIGILSSIVLVSVNTARNKAKDAAIQSNVSAVRTEAEMLYDSVDPNAYTTVCGATAAELGTYGNLQALEAGINNNTGVIVCHAAAGTYCVQSTLATDASVKFCIDNTGASGKSATNDCDGVNFNCAP